MDNKMPSFGPKPTTLVRRPRHDPEPGLQGGQDVANAVDKNIEGRAAGNGELNELVQQQHQRGDETAEPTNNDERDDSDFISFIMTITEDWWTLGNPTSVATITDDDTTITLLYFTHATVEWYNPNFGKSTTPLASGGIPFEGIPLPTTSSDVATTTESNEVEATSAPGPTESTSLTSAQASTTSIAASDLVTTADNGSDLSSGAIIGIVAGIGVFTIGTVIVLLLIFRHRHKKSVAATAAAVEPAIESPQQPRAGMDLFNHQGPTVTPSPSSGMVGVPYSPSEMEHIERGPTELGAKGNQGQITPQETIFAAELPADNYPASHVPNHT